MRQHSENVTCFPWYTLNLENQSRRKPTEDESGLTRVYLPHHQHGTVGERSRLIWLIQPHQNLEFRKQNKSDSSMRGMIKGPTPSSIYWLVIDTRLFPLWIAGLLRSYCCLLADHQDLNARFQSNPKFHPKTSQLENGKNAPYGAQWRLCPVLIELQSTPDTLEPYYPSIIPRSLQLSYCHVIPDCYCASKYCNKIEFSYYLLRALEIWLIRKFYSQRGSERADFTPFLKLCITSGAPLINSKLFFRRKDHAS